MATSSIANSRFRLDGKVCLVTGGGSGIGAAICHAYAEQGARVLLADVSEEGGRRTADALGEAGLFARADVTGLESLQAAVAMAVRAWGRLDVLVNCAGIGFVGNVQETGREDWERLLAVNVTGVFHGCQAAVDQFLGQEPKGGAIVNIASVAGQIGIPRRFAYCATKGAVIAMTKQLAVDYAGAGVRCNAICPGTVYTPFVEGYLDRFHRENKQEVVEELHARQPLGRMGRPEEIADLAVYLASDEAAFMTGSAVALDGGWTAQ